MRIADKHRAEGRALTISTRSKQKKLPETHMSRFNELLKSLDNLCETINALNFDSPGIFTNAIINKPDVTTLIRDPSSAEQSLYKITKRKGLGSLLVRTKGLSLTHSQLLPLIPERRDGKSVYVNDAANDDTGLVASRPQSRKRESDDEDNNDFNELSSPLKRRLVNQYNLISEEVLESDDFDAIFRTVKDVTQKYPNLVNDSKMPSTLELLSSRYEELRKLTADLESAIASQKQQYAAYNDDDFASPSRNLDELIRTEERLIEDLEIQLKEAQERI